jgi:tagatose-1,6-bisphosphate aldolase
MALMCKNVDLVFCIDTTGSMERFIKAVKETCKNLIDQVSTRTGIDSVKFAVVAYRDHDQPAEKQEYLTLVKDLTDMEEILTFIEELTAEGGGDPPEAIMDGINDSVTKISWREHS